MKKFKLWHILAAILLLFMIYDFLSDGGTDKLAALYGEVVGEPAEEPIDVQVIAPQPQPAQSAANETVTIVQEQSVLTPRQVSVPTYDTLIEAARLIQQANDIDVMKDYISLEKSRRNLLLRKENAQLETELKEIEAKYYKANAQVERLLSGETDDLSTFPAQGVISTMGGGDGSSMSDADEIENIRLMSIKQIQKDNYEIAIKINEKIYSSVKVGQRIDKFRLNVVDSKLKCVTLQYIQKNDFEIVCLN